MDRVAAGDAHLAKLILGTAVCTSRFFNNVGVGHVEVLIKFEIIGDVLRALRSGPIDQLF